MIYHVIIAQNSVGKRRVGEIISQLEKKGLEFLEIRKKSGDSRIYDRLNLNMLVLQSRLEELEAMDYYHAKFSRAVLEKKLIHFFMNNVELFFEGDGKSLDPHGLWISLSKGVFRNGRKLPIMFVVTSIGKNGLYESFIPENLDFDCVSSCVLRRTLMPTGV